jgi:hypothetical protein
VSDFVNGAAGLIQAAADRGMFGKYSKTVSQIAGTFVGVYIPLDSICSLIYWF